MYKVNNFEVPDRNSLNCLEEIIGINMDLKVESDGAQKEVKTVGKVLSP